MSELLRQITTTRERMLEEGIRTGGERESELFELPAERPVVWKGWGGCLNEAGIACLDTLPEQTRREILDELFLPERMGLCFCRLPIGANDYALSWYSYDETPEDYALAAFSVEHDRQYVLRFAREALARNPAIEFFASPWSPPSWMKEPPRYNGGSIRPEERVFAAYADYLVAYLRAYAREGVPVSILTPQNEFASDNNYPTCVWTGETMRHFIADHLGPALEQSGLSTQLYLGTINGTGTLGGFGTRYNEYTQAVLDDPEALRYVRGVAYQWEGRNALRQSVESYPELDYIQSENECGDGSNSWEYAGYVFELMRGYVTGGVSAYVYWNLILPRGGVSTWGWKQNSMLTTEAGRVRKEYEYALFRQASYARRGARVLRLGGHMSGNAFAFENADGTRVLLVQNPFSYEKRIRAWGVGCSLAPHSLSALLIG